MIILLHLLNDNRDCTIGFYWSSEYDVLFPVIYKWGLTSLNIQIGFQSWQWTYLLIIKKDSKTLATNNCPRRLINGNLERKMRKNTKRTFQSKQLADFSRLRLDADNVSYGHTCRKYPDIADQTSWMFIGKTMNRRDTWPSNQLSTKVLLALRNEGHQ